MNPTRDPVVDVFRSAYERVDAEVDDALEWSEIPRIASTVSPWTGFRIAAIAAAAMVVLVGSVAVLPFLRTNGSVAPSAGGTTGVVVGLNLDSQIPDANLKALRDALDAHPTVIDVRFVTQEEVLREVREAVSGSPKTLALIDANTDFYGAAVRVLVANMTDAKTLGVYVREQFPAPESGVLGQSTYRGTLLDPPPAYSIPPDPSSGTAWACPETLSQDDRVLTRSDTPEVLRYLPPGEINRVWGVDYGPACARPPALVAVQFADDGRTVADAVIVVWVESPTPEPFATSDVKTTFYCYEGSSTGERYCYDNQPTDDELAELTASLSTELIPVEYSDTGNPETEIDGFTIREYADRVVAIGVIDDLPVWIESSAMMATNLMELVGLMEADSTTGEIRATQPLRDMEIVDSAPAMARIIQHVVWYTEGPGTTIEVSRQPGFNVYAAAVYSPTRFGFIAVDGTTAIYTMNREGGDTSYLTWEISPGIVARLSVIGATTPGELVDIAVRVESDVES